ncbi:MAG: helix-turn-helix transcriptional regulator [Acetobacterium woodii]|nr:helix-turn-helix transcriptional regulator [Acetobacterium woodii]
MIGFKLRNMREAKNMTQADLSKDIGLSRERYNQYENDRRTPDLDTLLLLAKYFNVSTDYLLGRTDAPLPVRDVDRDLNDELDTESKWLNFLKTLSGDSMFYQYENIDEEQKLAIMDEYKEKLEKKKKKVEKFMDFSDEVIDEALNFAAYNQEQRKKKGDI